MDYTLQSEKIIIDSWTKAQLHSALHWISVFVFSTVTYFAFDNIYAMLVCYTVFFIVTALPRVYKMFIFFIITAIITALIPPLGIILTVIFFFARIGYIMENWKALFAGVLVYAYPFALYFYVKNNSFSDSTPIMISLTAGVVFHFILLWLYHSKFSTKNALGAMGAAPLFFIMLVLPFVIHEVSDVMDFDDFDDFSLDFDGSDYSSYTEIQNPGTHYVEGHWRDTPNGGHTYVDPHIRTNPDGIESNNISYKG